MSEKLEWGKWYPINVYYENQSELDWALVQFKETKTGFMPLPYRAEYLKRNKVWTTNSDSDRYLCELCEPIAFMLWQPYEEIREVNRELKKELFNIYDVVIFEDKNGITQDCVCSIGEDEIEDYIVGVVECNNHSIYIYKNGNYVVWEKDGKNLPYYATEKKIIHLYTLNNDNRFYEVYPTDDYGVTENVNPSEALECFENIKADLIGLPKHVTEYDDGFDNYLEDIWNNLDIIKQALIKENQILKEIISKKNVIDIAWLKGSRNYKEYNSKILDIYHSFNSLLTEKEFDLLKEVLENDVSDAN